MPRTDLRFMRLASAVFQQRERSPPRRWIPSTLGECQQSLRKAVLRLPESIPTRYGPEQSLPAHGP